MQTYWKWDIKANLTPYSALKTGTANNYYAQRAWQISAEQFNSVLSTMNRMANEPYSAYNQCGVWATEVIRSAGVGVPRELSGSIYPATMFKNLGGKF